MKLQKAKRRGRREERQQSFKGEGRYDGNNSQSRYDVALDDKDKIGGFNNKSTGFIIHIVHRCEGFRFTPTEGYGRWIFTEHKDIQSNRIEWIERFNNRGPNKKQTTKKISISYQRKNQKRRRRSKERGRRKTKTGNKPHET